MAFRDISEGALKGILAHDCRRGSTAFGGRQLRLPGARLSAQLAMASAWSPGPRVSHSVAACHCVAGGDAARGRRQRCALRKTSFIRALAVGIP